MIFNGDCRSNGALLLTYVFRKHILLRVFCSEWLKRKTKRIFSLIGKVAFLEDGSPGHVTFGGLELKVSHDTCVKSIHNKRCQNGGGACLLFWIFADNLRKLRHTIILRVTRVKVRRIHCLHCLFGYIIIWTLLLLHI